MLNCLFTTQQHMTSQPTFTDFSFVAHVVLMLYTSLQVPYDTLLVILRIQHIAFQADVNLLFIT